MTRISVTEVRRYERAGVVALPEDGRFTEADLRRLRRVRRLRRDLGLQLEAIAIILRLVERLEELERR